MKRFPLFFGLVAACALAACGQTAATPSADDAQADTQAADVAEDVTATTNYLALRPLSVAADRRIVDDLNREVILRGTNITSLGEYWQGDPDHKPTQELTEADWQEMAAQGFSANRLVVHWSKLEPTRGTMDEAYVQRIDDYVKAAAAHGMYTVIDMHQDAYSSFIFTTLPGDCTGTNHAAKGWDGAPKWATLTDGLSTCITGDRNSSPAVVAAWNHFYDNSDGIRDRFVATWGALAAHFAGRPEVAGYNFLNEPEVSRPGGELGPLYNQLVADVAKAVRAAEAKAAFGHLLIIEPAFAAGNPAFGLVVPDPASVNMDVQNVVAGPHNYAEAIGNGLNLSIEDMNQLYLGAANSIGVPMWIGEHGFWGTDDATLARLDRYAADEDKLVMGGAWWQWRQPCGDPHSVPIGGYKATGETNQQIHLHGLSCPGDKDLGPTEKFLRVLRRAVPRAAPGRIQTLTSDWKTGAFSLKAQDATLGAELVLWVPTLVGSFQVTTTGLKDVVAHEVTGGRWVTGTVAASLYDIEIAGK